MKYILPLIIIAIICLLTYSYCLMGDGTIKVRSEKDGNLYNVLESYTTKGGSSFDAANQMSLVNSFILELIGMLEDEYMKGKNPKSKNYIFTERLKSRYRSGILSENAPGDPESITYVYKKGELLKLCMREAETEVGELHSMNLLKFVAMHELAHIGTVEYGHLENFWDNFKFLIVSAKKYELYNPVDYSISPVIYCGLPINNNPYYI